MSDTHRIAEGAQAAAGWTDATLLDVVLDYVNNQDSGDAFADYLRERSGVDEPGECAICVPGQCPGADCPGNYAAAD